MEERCHKFNAIKTLFHSLERERSLLFVYLLFFNGKTKHLINDTLKCYKILFPFCTCVLTFFVLAWAQICFLDAVIFISPFVFFSILLYGTHPILRIFRLFLLQQRRAQIYQKSNIPCKMLYAFCLVRWEHTISCRTCLCEWLSGRHPKGYELLLLGGFSFLIGCEMGPDIVSAVIL